jgi:hypothetical protein
MRARLPICIVNVAVAEASPSPRQLPRPPSRGWTFITNHAQVLLAVAQDSDLRVREIAEATGITERYAYRVLGDLQSAGYVDRVRHGRCNLYRIHPDLPLGDPVVEPQSLNVLLLLNGRSNGSELGAADAPRRRSA